MAPPSGPELSNGGDNGGPASSSSSSAAAKSSPSSPTTPKYSPLSASSPSSESRRLSWSQRMREYRHNPCLMKPATALLVTIIALLSIVGLALQLPTFLLGLILSPLMRRGSWFVEFLYPAGISRYVHIALMRWGLHSKMGTAGNVRGRVPPQHSRTVEQRTEVVKGRVYVHPIPQLLDNVGYLIVCCPPPPQSSAGTAAAAGGGGGDAPPILGILVDCGDATSALAQIRQIRDAHYSDSPPPRPDIQIHAVLCTHKHHDHTAGNRGLLADETVSKTLAHVYGGAVEDVPYANRLVTNGQRIDLPRVGANDMSDVVEIECIAVPSHTRGSVVYALRNKVAAEQQQGQEEDPCRTEPGNSNSTSTNGIVSHLFTGDAMFSGGGGVAFEADVETPRDKNLNTKNRNSLVKVTAGRSSIERCFAEVLVRGGGIEGGGSGDGDGDCDGGAAAAAPASTSTSAPVAQDAGYAGRVMMFPGHEYTADLLLRQLDQSNEYHGQWTKLPPGVFFETASQYLVSSHRRTLPKSGRLLTVPSPLARELKTNPHFRTLRKRGEHLLSSVRVWHRYMSKGRPEVTHKVGGLVVQQSTSSLGIARSSSDRRNDGASGGDGNILRSSSSLSYKTPSTNTTWNMDHNDVNRSVFATVYASDLESVIADLQSGSIGSATAARRLEEMRDKLDEPVVSRRPIPGTLPSERNMYLGVVAMALLGSPPCGMTVGDSVAMNLPPPVDSSDEILISKRRLLAVLSLLGLLQQRSEEDEDGYDMVELIGLLWKEARMDDEMDATSLQVVPDGERINEKPPNKPNYNATTDVEATPPTDGGDEIELGLLKLTLYGAALNQPSWFKKFCLPCGGGPPEKTAAETIDETASAASKMRRSNGELVRHDITTCPMCRDVVGAPCAISERAAACEDRNSGDDDDGASVEDMYHQSVLMEGIGGSSTSDEPERSDGVELRVVPGSL